MKEHSIIFSGESVRAILADHKTQTRRVVRVQPPQKVTGAGVIISGNRRSNGLWSWLDGDPKDIESQSLVGDDFRCLYGVPGDHLWVRETFVQIGSVACYRATQTEQDARGIFNWKSPVYMPRWASRLKLEIVNVRAERVQDISEEDALAEGIQIEEVCPGGDPDNFHPPGSYGFVSGIYPFPKGKIYQKAQQAFAELWDSINAERGFGWDKNIWVWVIQFRRVS